MKNIYITGDRSMSPMMSVGAVDAVIKDLIDQTDGDIAIGTGTCMTGVERAVRYLIPEGMCNIAPYKLDDEGNIDFKEVFEMLEPQTDLIVFIHMDPLSSRIGRAIAAVFPEEKVTMPLQEAMVGL